MESRETEWNGIKVTCYEDGSIERVDGNTKKLARTMGCKNSLGYRIIGIGGEQPLQHRVIAKAWLPNWDDSLNVDHINGIRSDNRPNNIRIGTQSQNMRGHVRTSVGASSKHRGVCWDKRRGKWSSKIKFNGKTTNLGRFKCEIGAAKAYNAAAITAGFQEEALNQF